MPASPPAWSAALPAPAARALAAHHATLEAWRPVMDLVGPGASDPHFEDAILAVRALPVAGRWADLGSGAGFPGVALAALHPDAEVLLVERRSKRATFLRTVVEAAGLANARVVEGDAEDVKEPLNGIISRAFAPPARLWPLAARLLPPGGVLAMMLAKEEANPPDGWAPFHVERYRVGDRERRIEAWQRENGP